MDGFLSGVKTSRRCVPVNVFSLHRPDGSGQGEATYLGIDSSCVLPNHVCPLSIPKLRHFGATQPYTRYAVLISLFTPTIFTSDNVAGLGHYPLSGMALVDPAHENFEPVPFTNDLRKQHDLDVLCLPYTFTPTDIPAWIRSAKLGYDPIQDHNLQTIRSAVSCHSYAYVHCHSSVTNLQVTWYPVLLPVYLATYKAVLQGLTYSITFAVEGFRKKVCTHTSLISSRY